MFFKVSAMYLFLMLSLALPPLLIISVPLAIVMTVRLVERRRSTITLAQRVAMQKRDDATARYFR